MAPRIRRIAFGVWILFSLGVGTLYLINPTLLRPETLVERLRQSGQYASSGYVAVSIVRAFTFLPSTVLVVAGTLLFPDRPWFVLASSLTGIVISSVLIYFFFEFLGLGELFERRHANRVRWLENQLQSRGFWIVVAWSAFPFVPTDLICYVAGTLRMRFDKFVLGVVVGELPLVGFYVMVGSQLYTG